MAQLNTYLNFNGNCREAMTFYKDCIGGELTFMTVGETPVANELPDEMRNMIMHCKLEKNGITLMASDMNRGKLADGNTMHLMLDCDSEEEIREYFSKLSEGGKVLDPLSDTFWGAVYGALTDKYGKSWMFNFTRK